MASCAHSPTRKIRCKCEIKSVPRSQKSIDGPCYRGDPTAVEHSSVSTPHMKSSRILLLACLWLFTGNAHAQSFRAQIRPLINSACMDCHDADTQTDLNLQAIGYDLTEPRTFQRWERICDRVSKGEMPPASADRPDPLQSKQALGSLQAALRSISRDRQRRIGRVPARRMTKREYQYTLRDLLHIEGDVGAAAQRLPAGASRRRGTRCAQRLRFAQSATNRQDGGSGHAAA